MISPVPGRSAPGICRRACTASPIRENRVPAQQKASCRQRMARHTGAHLPQKQKGQADRLSFLIIMPWAGSPGRPGRPRAVPPPLPGRRHQPSASPRAAPGPGRAATAHPPSATPHGRRYAGRCRWARLRPGLPAKREAFALGGAGQFPEPRQQPPSRSAVEQHSRRGEHHPHPPLFDPPGLFRGLHRQAFRVPGGAGGAELPCRTLPAPGRSAGQADHRPQFHERLGEVPGCPLRIERRQFLPALPLERRGIHRGFIAGDAAHHPQHIAVHCRGGQSEGDGADSSGGILADARQRLHSLIVTGQLAAVLFTDRPGCLLKVPHPAVIPQPLPEFQELFLRGGCQGRNIRKLPQEPLIIGQHSLHTGLLEHDLRYPHPIGPGVLPPGQDAAVGRYHSSSGAGSRESRE